MEITKEVAIIYLRNQSLFMQINPRDFFSIQFTNSFDIFPDLFKDPENYYLASKFIIKGKEDFHVNMYLQNIFKLFNSDENPLLNNESQKIIKYYFSHTTLSIGDIIKLNEQIFMVTHTGFQDISDKFDFSLVDIHKNFKESELIYDITHKIFNPDFSLQESDINCSENYREECCNDDCCNNKCSTNFSHLNNNINIDNMEDLQKILSHIGFSNVFNFSSNSDSSNSDDENIQSFTSSCESESLDNNQKIIEITD